MKSNIDQLFEEKLKELQRSPSQEVWDILESQLGKIKKEKKITQWKWMGIAASMLAFLLVGYQIYFYSTSSVQSNNNLLSSKDTLTIYNPFVKKIISPSIAHSIKNKTKKKLHKYKNEVLIENNSKLIAQSDFIKKQDATSSFISASSRKSITIEITIEEKNYVSMDQTKEKKKWINKTIRFLTRLKKAEIGWEELSLKNQNKNEEHLEK